MSSLVEVGRWQSLRLQSVNTPMTSVSISLTFCLMIVLATEMRLMNYHQSNFLVDFYRAMGLVVRCVMVGIKSG